MQADSNDERLYAVKWVPPGWPWVDPLKDVRANVMEVRAGFTTRDTVVSEQGEDAEAIDAENAASNRRADGLGLEYDSDGRQKAAGGAESATTPAQGNPLGGSGGGGSASTRGLTVLLQEDGELVPI